MRVQISRCALSLERILRRKLYQTRRANRARYLTEIRWAFDIDKRRIREIRMVEQIEKIGGNAQPLFLGYSEPFAGREIPVLLERTAESVASQVAEAGGSVRADRGGGSERIDVDVIIQAAPEISVSQRIDARNQIGRRGRSRSQQAKRGRRRRVNHGEGRAGLKGRDAAKKPST